MRKALRFLIVLTALMTGSCATVRMIDYSQTSVPQEGGYQFRQITSEEQSVWGPMVKKENGKLQWFTGAMFDISEDGEKIVYIAGTPGQNEGNVYVRSTAGGRSSVQRTFNISASSPSFSPDGNSISFSGTFPGQTKSNICVINTNEGSAIQHLTESQSGLATEPVFSSDGERIFYTRGISTTSYVGTTPYTTVLYSIWSMNKNTSITTQYVEGSSPDYITGDKLLFTKVNVTTGNGEIWMLDLNSGQETLILRDNERGFSTPKISPDGRSLLCTGASTSAEGPNLDIYQINIDGTGLKQITFHPGTDASPVWAPDGKSIYFISQRGTPKGTYNIWSIDLTE
ncbi:MAG: PD40 domain-containing protein [Bacteroidales bacterium]|nr:PD40 domain-containing protein [Bacteroidales bacterium]